jgi:hypothetical protein
MEQNATTLFEQPYMNLSAANSRVSDRYTFVNTRTLVERCMDVGLLPSKHSTCTQERATAKHTVTMRHAKMIEGAKVGQVIPEITIMNSADGMSKLKVHGGLYRLVCSNGMVMPMAGATAALVTRHTNVEMAWVEDVLQSAMNAAVQGAEVADALGGIYLSGNQVIDYAKYMVSVPDIAGRFYSKTSWNGSDIDNLLERLRPADEENNLWNVMNVVQEKIMRGNFKIEKDSGQIRGVKPLANSIRQVELNQTIWAETEAFAKSL